MRIQAKDLVQRGNTLQVKLEVLNQESVNVNESETPEYLISGALVFQIKVIAEEVRAVNGRDQIFYNFVYVKFKKLQEDVKFTYTMKFTSKKLRVYDKRIACDDGTWQLVGYVRQHSYDVDFSVNMAIDYTNNPFAELHENDTLADLHMYGNDGFIKMHKSIIASVSPFMKLAFDNQNQISSTRFDVPDTSTKTLQAFKNYVYARTVPDSDIEQLMLLASYFEMPDLEQICVDKLMNSLNTEKAFELLDFAGKHKMRGLTLAILSVIGSGTLKLKDMCQHHLRSK